MGGPNRSSDPVGTLFNVQRFSLHDGPGIRSVVFLKGCPRGAIRESAGSLVTDLRRCTACGSCVAACPSGAREMAGFQRTVSEMLVEVVRDRPFYASSGRGLTLSGGEPAAQADFCLTLLDRASHAGVHGAMETSGCCAPEIFAGLARACDLVLSDLKTADRGRFRQQPGGELGLVRKT